MGCVSQTFVPEQILSAVEATPVPVGPHYGINEFGIILRRSFFVVLVAWLDIVGGCGYRSGRHESGEYSSKRLHADIDVVH